MLVTTVNDPTQKIPNKPTFCLFGICSPTTMRIGSANKMMSETMLATAVAMYRLGWFRHSPSTLMSQFCSMGRQAKTRGKKMPME